MGNVDLNFQPSVPVFDANVALGRRHDKRVSSDTTEGALEVMDKAGVGRALVYHQHAVNFDGHEGNQILLDMIQGEPRLVPQFACNPTFDNLHTFAEEVAEMNVRSVRMNPTPHRYSFRDWVVGPWLEWLTSEGIPLSLDAMDFEPTDLYDTLKKFPDVTILLNEIHYSHVSWTLPLLKNLPNVHIEISRLLIPDGIERAINSAGSDRVLFGSRFPASQMAPQLYNLYRCGLSESALKSICADNLVRLLGVN